MVVTKNNVISTVDTTENKQISAIPQKTWLPADKARIAAIASGAFAALIAAGVFLLTEVQGGRSIFEVGGIYFSGLALSIVPSITLGQYIAIGVACISISMVAAIALAGYSGAKLGSYAYNKYTSI